MGTVIIREYGDMARPRAGGANVGSYVLDGVLVTDEEGASIKTVTTGATAVDCEQLTAKTHFIVMESDTAVRYRIRPRNAKRTVAAASANYPLLPASALDAPVMVVEAVYPGAIISFIDA